MYKVHTHFESTHDHYGFSIMFNHDANSVNFSFILINWQLMINFYKEGERDASS